MHGEVSSTGYFTAGQAVHANLKSEVTPVIHAGTNGSGKKFSGFRYRIDNGISKIQTESMNL